MRKWIALGTGAVALLASIGFAAAQGMGATSAPMKQNPPAASAAGEEQISLNDQQRQTIWQTLSKARAETAPSDFQASVGADVPRSMRLHSFSRALTDQVPAMRGYEYAKLQNRVLIVNPRTRKIIDTVNGG